MTDERDILIIGGGPAGQHAAQQAASLGRRATLIERDHALGGSCVSKGTIPSKTLRETALALTGFRRKSADLFPVALSEDLQVASLMTRLDQVVTAHQRYMGDQLARFGCERVHGRARFLDAHTLEVVGVDGARRRFAAAHIVIATGSRPRAPREIPIDHEHILDSDSILSLTYLPRSLTVLGAGVIATEYASIFASLGVKVTMIDKGPRPLGFLDAELVGRFLDVFQAGGNRYLGGVSAKQAQWDGVSTVQATLSDGSVVESDKLFCALGRVANLEDLDLPKAGLAASDRGVLPVDAVGRTAVPHIFACGDVIGPPSLASSSMDQGRRCVNAACGLESAHAPDLTPMGIYAIPEMSQVGLTQDQAVAKHGGCLVGRAPFSEVARGQIAAIQEGLLKLIVAPDGRTLLGAAVVGESAAELVSIAQMALINGNPVDVFVEHTFNFPTMAEAYRVAALDVLRQRSGAGSGSRPGAAAV